MKNEIEGKNILVVGLGRSGIAACQALVKLGANVSVQDSKKEEDVSDEVLAFLKDKNIKYCLGCSPKSIKDYQMIVPSPGVPLTLDFIVEAKKAGVEISGELEIAYRMGKGKCVAITGTNGKTTTTTLVGEMFQASGRDTCIVGNIGVAVINKAIAANDDTWLVTEISSFQLETIDQFKPEISAILNLTPDHLDRHGNMENYGLTKANIFKNQKRDSCVVMNFDDKESFALATKTKAKVVPFSREEKMKFGAFVKNDKIVIADYDGKIIEFCKINDLQIPGLHNLENALAATAIAFFSGINPKVITETLRNFSGVEHRIEYCGTIVGIKYVNDSKGTNTDAAIKAIEAMKKNIILIAGGYDKGAEYEKFISAFSGRVKHAVLMGATASKIKITAEKMGFSNTTIMKDMEDCVREASRVAKKGDIVLLSPACASWDMYDNFEQRGEHFKECVERLER